MKLKNCIILGSGRSGTSLAAGVLASAGYFMGERLYAADESNPKGYFEDEIINRINEKILMQILPEKLSGLGRLLFPSRLCNGQRWLGEVPLSATFEPNHNIIDEIKIIVSNEPFCFKDPRFSYTLSVWRQFLKNTTYICVFRNPADTALSILKICKREEYLKGLPINYEKAFNVWRLMYQHILFKHLIEKGDWVFFHYDQFIDGSALDKLRSILNLKIDYAFPDKGLKRSIGDRSIIPRDIALIYGQLCELAGYREIIRLCR